MSRWKLEPHCTSILQSYKSFLYIMIWINFIIFANLKNHKHISQKLNPCSLLSVFGRQVSVKSSKRSFFNALGKYTKFQPVAATFALISLLPPRESPTVPHIKDSQADSCKCNSSLSSYR